MTNKENFISAIKENRKLIYKICHLYCLHNECRNDLQQEILLQLWITFPKFDGRVKISTWMYKIALNTAISFYRNESKHKNNHVEIDDLVLTLTDFNSVETEEIKHLYTCIYQLNEFDKAIILLYLDDKSYKEIAQIMGITETNVATKLNRIKNKLKEQFNNQ